MGLGIWDGLQGHSGGLGVWDLCEDSIGLEFGMGWRMLYRAGVWDEVKGFHGAGILGWAVRIFCGAGGLGWAGGKGFHGLGIQTGYKDSMGLGVWDGVKGFHGAGSSGWAVRIPWGWELSGPSPPHSNPQTQRHQAGTT